MLSLFFVLVEFEYEFFGEGFFQYINFRVVLAWSIVPFHYSRPFPISFAGFSFFVLILVSIYSVWRIY